MTPARKCAPRLDPATLRWCAAWLVDKCANKDEYADRDSDYNTDRYCDAFGWAAPELMAQGRAFNRAEKKASALLAAIKPRGKAVHSRNAEFAAALEDKRVERWHRTRDSALAALAGKFYTDERKRVVEWATTAANECHGPITKDPT